MEELEKEIVDKETHAEEALNADIDDVKDEVLVNEETVEDTVSSDVKHDPASEKKPKKSKKILPVLLVLAVAGGGYYAYDQSQRNTAYQEALDKIELTAKKNTLEYSISGSTR